MAVTPYMRIPIPVEGQSPWYQKFLEFISGVDTALFATMEDRNVFVTGGGGWSFVGNVISWEDPFYIDCCVTGHRMVVPAGNITILNNYYLYVEMTRALMSTGTGVVATANYLGRSNTRLMIGQRRDAPGGGRLYFRTGITLWQGDVDIHVLEDGSRGGYAIHGATHLAASSDPIPGIETQESLYNCTAGEVFGNAVYLFGSDAVRNADCGPAAALMPAIGIIAAKPTAITCFVLTDGDLDGFVGLTPGADYYVGAAGAITTVAPVLPGAIVQLIGYAKNTTTLHVEPGDAITLT